VPSIRDRAGRVRPGIQYENYEYIKTQVTDLTEVPCLVGDGLNRIGVEETLIYWEGLETPAVMIGAGDIDAPHRPDCDVGLTPRYGRMFAALDEGPLRPDCFICLTPGNARILARLLDRIASRLDPSPIDDLPAPAPDQAGGLA
jgi:hypothetical protein